MQTIPPPPPSTNTDPTLGNLKGVSGLAKAVQILTGIIGLIAAVQIPLEIKLASALRAAWDQGKPISGSEDTIWLIAGLAGVFLLVGALITGILTVILMKRMADNGALMNPGMAERKTHWAITGWFVPFLNFVRPYQMMNQIWMTSRERDAKYNLEMPDVVKLWWGAFLLSGFVARATPTAPWEGASYEQIADESIGIAITAPFTITAAVLFVMTIRLVTERHEKAIQQFVPAAMPAPDFPLGATPAPPVRPPSIQHD